MSDPPGTLLLACAIHVELHRAASTCTVRQKSKLLILSEYVDKTEKTGGV